MKREATGLLQVGTLAGWLFCLTVGVVGLVLPYARPVQPAVEPPVMTAMPLSLELAPADPLPEAIPAPAAAGSLSRAPLPRPLPQPALVPPAPALVPVVEAAEEAAFPIPAAALAEWAPEGGNGSKDQSRSASEAAGGGGRASTAAAPVKASVPAVERLEHGVGQGRQPMSYPPAAARLGQEGTVVVRFSVDPSGRVLEAQVVGPSPWPVLNASAAAQIRQRWRFPPGAARLYEVSITFQLKQRP